MKPPAATPTELVWFGRTIDSAAIGLYATLCNDFNPIHVDAEFASGTPFGRPIAHGTLTLALVWEAFDLTFGRDVLAGAEVELRFVRPVPVDTRVTASGTLATGPRGDRWDIEVQDGNGVVVLTGTVRLAAAHPSIPTE